MHWSSEDGSGVGAFSRRWSARVATVSCVAVPGTLVGLAFGETLVGLIVGVIAGVSCVVMGESSMDTGAYKYPEKSNSSVL